MNPGLEAAIRMLQIMLLSKGIQEDFLGGGLRDVSAAQAAVKRFHETPFPGEPSEAPEPASEAVPIAPGTQRILALKTYLGPSGKRSWNLPAPYLGDVNDPTVDQPLIDAARQLEAVIEERVNQPGFTLAGMVMGTTPGDLEQAYQVLSRQTQAWDVLELIKQAQGGGMATMDSMGLPSKDDSAQTVSVTTFVLDPDATATLQTGDPDTSQQIAKSLPHVLPGTHSKVELLDEIIERVLNGEEPPFGEEEPTVPREQIRRWRL
jgi:hypothetical protein